MEPVIAALLQASRKLLFFSRFLYFQLKEQNSSRVKSCCDGCQTGSVTDVQSILALSSRFVVPVPLYLALQGPAGVSPRSPPLPPRAPMLLSPAAQGCRQHRLPLAPARASPCPPPRVLWWQRQCPGIARCGAGSSRAVPLCPCAPLPSGEQRCLRAFVHKRGEEAGGVSRGSRAGWDVPRRGRQCRTCPREPGLVHQLMCQQVHKSLQEPRPRALLRCCRAASEPVVGFLLPWVWPEQDSLSTQR